MATTILLSPPVVFIIVLLVVICLSNILSKLAFKPKNKLPDGLTEPYACGENLPTHMIQPDYTQFFPFAFYFTILHVVALMVALVPARTPETLVMAVIYIFGAIIGLTVLYRR